MSSHYQLLARVLGARLSRRIALWILFCIVLIEFVILVPSVYRRRQELLQNLSITSSGKIAWIVETYPRQSGDELLRQLENLSQLNPDVKGGSLYSRLTGELIGEFGEPPQLTLAEAQQEKGKFFKNPVGDRYDAVCDVMPLADQYIMVIRHDASDISKEVTRFIIRIAGLVLIIAVFVTGGSIIVLERLIITPILNLRSDLIQAGNAISENQAPPKFYSARIQRTDELGDVITAFTQMFNQIYSASQARDQAETALRLEKEKSEKLLLNVLPQPIAEKLKQGSGSIADRFDQATILFADITNFTELSAKISPTDLVSLLNEIFSSFDCLVDQYNLEKIKTIGDAYMVVGGIPVPFSDHAESIAEVALEMQHQIQQFRQIKNQALNIRIGINTGPVIAGVIGLRKFIYDLWGDAVNIASRMESQGIPGKIQVSEATYHRLKDKYFFTKRGTIQVKGKGEMTTYILWGRR